MELDLGKWLDRVNDRESFFRFVRVLIQDRKESVKREVSENASDNVGAPSAWQNQTIEDFLESALAWAKDTQMGYKLGLERELSWKSFAVFLYCGKIYE